MKITFTYSDTPADTRALWPLIALAVAEMEKRAAKVRKIRPAKSRTERKQAARVA